MPTLIIPGAYQVSLHADISGQEIVNVLGVTSDGFGAANQVATKVRDAWSSATGPMSLLPAAYKLMKVKVTDLASAAGEIYELSTNIAGKGSAVNGALSTCAVVRIGAGTRSRSGKGRVYYGPIQSTHLSADGRTLTGPAMTTYLAAFQAFQTQVNTDGLQWAVLSRKLSLATPVQSISVASVIGTQRRRLR